MTDDLGELRSRDPLGRYHTPDETAKIAELAEAGLKERYRDVYYPEETSGREVYRKGERWGGGESGFERWLKDPNSVDLEFRVLMKEFLGEEYGVKDLDNLRILVEAEGKEFEVLRRRCEHLSSRKELTQEEKEVVGLWFKNYRRLRETKKNGSLFDDFRLWLDEKEGPSSKVVQSAMEKTDQYLALFEEGKNVVLYYPANLEPAQRKYVEKWLGVLKNGAEKLVINKNEKGEVERIFICGNGFYAYVDIRTFFEAFGIGKNYILSSETTARSLAAWFESNKGRIVFEDPEQLATIPLSPKLEIRVKGLPSRVSGKIKMELPPLQHPSKARVPALALMNKNFALISLINLSLILIGRRGG